MKNEELDQLQEILLSAVHNVARIKRNANNNFPSWKLWKNALGATTTAWMMLRQEFPNQEREHNERVAKALEQNVEVL
jgi:hypothetical protein